MSDASQGPGWWLASDGKWYPPEAAPGSPSTESARRMGRFARLPRLVRIPLLVLLGLLLLAVAFNFLVGVQRPNRSWSEPAIADVNTFHDDAILLAQANSGTDVSLYKSRAGQFGQASAALAAKLRSLGSPPKQAAEWTRFEADLDRVGVTAQQLSACPSDCSLAYNAFSSAVVSTQADGKLVAGMT